MSPPDLPCIKRLDTMEIAVAELQTELAAIRAGQTEHTAHLAAVAEMHAQQLGVEAEKLRESIATQSQSILAVSQAMIHLQQAVQKWAAAGTLGGAVVLYIIAKVAGL